jgi:hypothetical protein
MSLPRTVTPQPASVAHKLPLLPLRIGIPPSALSLTQTDTLSSPYPHVKQSTASTPRTSRTISDDSSRGARAPRPRRRAADRAGADIRRALGRPGPGAGLHARSAEPDAVPDVRGAPQRADAAGQGLLRRAVRRRGRRRGRLLLRPRGWVRRPRRPRARARAAHHLPRGRAAAQALRCAWHARRRAPGRHRRCAGRVRYGDGVLPLCPASANPRVIISRFVAFFNVAVLCQTIKRFVG